MRLIYFHSTFHVTLAKNGTCNFSCT